jgi:hypothetical protein
MACPYEIRGGKICANNQPFRPQPPAPSLQAPAPLDAALADLAKEVCFCGAPKRKHNSFCTKHFYALPRGLRNRLRVAMSDGYAEVYAAARAELKDQDEGNGRRP